MTTVRLSVSLPDDIYASVLRLANASNVSCSATVRAILSDVVPRMTSVMDYLGTHPDVGQTDVADADLWLHELQALYSRAPATFKDAVGDFQIVPPPAVLGHD